ncbi:MAG: hypothetical protein I3273_05935 [Candidatus Moeniiplasma glomeromycotorum]|nr:hypothetical protein [Candidatus Moeniiplasma glomeromycotorum]MCE8168066.1 hypothetical protein [Candidatus Moeniiplasma glomeromycotorum]MCE8169625.1 hypothetical protein [Candidatus Moeniiplasma glomeromycotorum]
MIINPSSKVPEHEIVFKKVEMFFRNLKLSEDNQLQEKIKKAFKEIKNSSDDNLHNKLIDQFQQNLSCCKVSLINSKNEKKAPGNPITHTIYIGGSSIGRGLTFNRLLTAYITNRAKGTQNMDTSLQRGRWFGYKREEDLWLYRFWCTEKIDQDYETIRDEEQKIFHKAEEYSKQWPHKKISKWDLTILANKNQRPTRSEVAKLKIIKTRGSYYQYLPVSDEENRKKEETFYKKLMINNYDSFANTKAIYDDGVHKEKLFPNLQSFSKFIDENIGEEFLTYIMREKLRVVPEEIRNQIFEKSVKDEIRVRFIIMNSGEEDSRGLESGKIKNIFQKTQYWEGERSQKRFHPKNHPHNNEIVFQAWNFKIKEGNKIIYKELYFYALFLPNIITEAIKIAVQKANLKKEEELHPHD